MVLYLITIANYILFKNDQNRKSLAYYPIFMCMLGHYNNKWKLQQSCLAFTTSFFSHCWSECATKRARAKGNRNNDDYSNKRLLYWFTWARNNIFLSNFQCIFLFTHSFHPWVTWSFVDSWSAMTVFFMFCICYVFRFFFSSFYLLIFMFFCVSYQLTYVHLLPLKISITSKIPITISPQIDAKEPFKMPSKKLNPIFFSLVLCVFLVLIDWNRMSLLLKERKKRPAHIL